MCVLFDAHAVIHLIDPEDLRLPAVAAKLVVLAHDQGLDRLGRANLQAESAKAAPREIEIEIVEDLDLGARLAVAAERDEIVGARLGALVANDASLCASPRLGLQPQHPAEARRGRPALGGILEREG